MYDQKIIKTLTGLVFSGECGFTPNGTDDEINGNE